MRNFSWHCFQSTGDVDAYLLYKELTPASEWLEWREQEVEQGDETERVTEI